MLQPYKGANTAQFYVAELTPGVTPTSPSWSTSTTPRPTSAQKPVSTSGTAASAVGASATAKPCNWPCARWVITAQRWTEVTAM